MSDTQAKPTATTWASGPWRLEQEAYGRIYSSALRPVATIDPSSQASANARLIAAAPELFDVLEHALNAFDPKRDSDEGWCVRARSLLSRISGQNRKGC